VQANKYNGTNVWTPNLEYKYDSRCSCSVVLLRRWSSTSTPGGVVSFFFATSTTPGLCGLGGTWTAVLRFVEFVSVLLLLSLSFSLGVGYFFFFKEGGCDYNNEIWRRRGTYRGKEKKKFGLHL